MARVEAAMQKTTIFGVLGIVFGLTLSTLAAANALGVASSIQATQRRIAGVITAVDASSVTIHGKSSVTGRVGGNTRVVIDGRVARVADLRVTENAKAELGLDDIWASIVVSTK
jgi:hypothetical protein